MNIFKYLTKLVGALRQTADAARSAEIEEGRHIFAASPDLILITDTQGNIVRISPSCEKSWVTGRTR
jgi:PAS domain-containing protein